MEHDGPGTPFPAREAVLSNPDLLASTLFHLNLLDLATSCSVSRAFCAASTERVRGLNVLRWDRTIRGREAQLAETGFYFHRHILMLPDGTFCAPDVNNHSLRTLDDESPERSCPSSAPSRHLHDTPGPPTIWRPSKDKNE